MTRLRRVSWTVIRGLTGAALLLALLCPPAAAQRKSYSIDGYDVVVSVQPDGSYRVTERIAYDFTGGTFSYATREIPLRHIRDLALTSVTGDDAQVAAVESSRSGGTARIRWRFAPTVGRNVFKLDYIVWGALFESGGLDIVDWDAIGRRWTVPIRDVHVTVLLPVELAPDSAAIRVLPEEGRLTRDDDDWRMDFSHAALPAGTAYRVVVAFPRRLAGRTDWAGVRGLDAGVAASPAPAGAQRGTSPPGSYAWLLPLAALAGLLPGLLLFLGWRGPRREAAPGGAPPAALPRAAAILPELGGGPARVFAAVLFDLAGRGYLELRRVAVGRGIFRQKKVEVVFHEVPADSLSAFERGLLEEIRRYPTLDDFGRRAGAYRRTATRQLRETLVREHLLEEHGRRSGLLLACGLLAVAAGAVLLITRGVSLLPLAVLLFAGSVGLFLAAARVRTPTEAGALLRAQVQAHLDALRGRVEDLRRSSAVQAAEAYLRDIAWLTLDPKVTPYWLGRIASALKKSEDTLETPGWATDLADRATTGSAAYVAFMPYHYVTTAAAGAAAPGSGGAGSAGAGAGGGAGGGGGGAG